MVRFFNFFWFRQTDSMHQESLRQGEQPLCKKGRGKLIHISDFVNPETGQLIVTEKLEISCTTHERLSFLDLMAILGGTQSN